MFDELLKTAKKALSFADIISHPIKSAAELIPDNSNAGIIKNTIKGLPDAAIDVAKQTAKGLKDQVVNPSPTQRDFENKTFNVGIQDVPNWEKPLYKAATIPAKFITRIVNPGLEPLGQDIGQLSYFNEAVDKVRKGQLPLSTIDELSVLHKTAPQIVGDVTQAVLTAYSGGEATEVGLGTKPAVKTISQIISEGAKSGLKIGTGFGAGQALSSGSTDPFEILSTLGTNQVMGGILGAITSGAVPVGEKAIDAVKIAKDAYDAMSPRMKQGGYIANPFGEEPQKVKINGNDVEIKPEDVIDFAKGNRTDDALNKVAQDKGIDTTDTKAVESLRDELNVGVKKQMDAGNIVENADPKGTTYEVKPELEQSAKGIMTIAEAKIARDVSTELNKKFRSEAKDIAAEHFGRGETTGYFKGEKEGRKLGEKIGEFKTEKEYQSEIFDIKKKFKDKANSQAIMRESIRQFAENNLPMKERGRYLNAAANTSTYGELNKAFNRLVKASDKYREILAYNREVSTRAQKLGFIRKIGEFSNTLIRDIKQKLNISGSFRDLSPEQLDVVIDEAKKRLQFKKDNNALEANKTVQPTGRQSTPEELAKYRAELQEYNSTKNTTARKVNKVKEAVSDFGKDAMVPFSSRLKDISPVLKKVFRNEFDAPLRKTIYKDSKAVEPLFKFKKKMSASDFADLDYMLKNGDIKGADAVAKKYGFDKELNQARALLQSIYERASAVGEMGFIRDYFPRIVKDKEGLLKYIETSEDHVPINEAIKNREAELGRELDQTERLQIINTMLRGFDTANVNLSDIGNMKSRKIQELTPEMAKYYDDSFSALQRYIESMNEVIQARKFFGKSIKAQGYEVPAWVEAPKIEDTIAAYVDELMVKGKLNPEKAAELSDLLKARFNPARVSGFTSFTKDLISLQALNSIAFGINNLQDLTTAIYRFGWLRTGMSGLKVIAQGIPVIRDMVPKLKLSSKEIGLDRMNENIQSGSRFKKLVGNVLKITSLNTDHFTRSTYIDAMLAKYEKDALKQAAPELMKRLEDSLLDKDIAPVLEALRNKTVNEAVEKLAYNEIADYQPVSISEMPVDYIKGDKSRLLYSLKSYIVKQFDYMRQEHWAAIKANPKSVKPYTDLAKFAFALMVTGAATETINDVLFNRSIKPNEVLLNNFIRMFGVSRYTFYQAKNSGLKSAIANTIFPGFGPLEDAFKDAANPPDELRKLESIKSIPFFGRPLYWWVGKGADSEAKKAEKESKAGGGLTAKDIGLSAKDLGITAKDLGLSDKDLGL